MRGHRGRLGLAARLFAAQLLAIVAGSLALGLTALAPGLFRIHARQAFAVLPPGGRYPPGAVGRTGMLVALGIAAAASPVTALAAS